MEKQSHRSIQFWWHLLSRPGRAFSSYSPNLWITLVLLGLLVIVSMLRTFLTITDPDLMRIALSSTALGILTAWLSLSLLLHAVAVFLGAPGKFFRFLGCMALASVPVTLTTLLSVIVYRSFPHPGFHTMLGWVGMIWGWPGLFTYYALVHGNELRPRTAAIIVIIVLVLISIGWFLPALMSLPVN